MTKEELCENKERPVLGAMNLRSKRSKARL